MKIRIKLLKARDIFPKGQVLVVEKPIGDLLIGSKAAKLMPAKKAPKSKRAS